MSRIGIVVWGIVAGAATCVVNKAGINVNWMIIIIGESQSPCGCLDKTCVNCWLVNGDTAGGI